MKDGDVLTLRDGTKVTLLVKPAKDNITYPNHVTINGTVFVSTQLLRQKVNELISTRKSATVSPLIHPCDIEELIGGLYK